MNRKRQNNVRGTQFGKKRSDSSRGSGVRSQSAAANTLKRHLIAKLNATFSKSCYDFNFNLPFDVSVQLDAKNSARDSKTS